MKHICTLIKEAKTTGPFTIANTGAKVNQIIFGNLSMLQTVT